MPTLEERVQALEQENAARKKAEELLTITVRALVTKEAFEKLQETINAFQEQNGKLFDVINTHNAFTNEQLAELRNQHTELDGKIVGLQTDMHQRFEQQDGKIVGLQTEMRQRFTEQDSKIVGLNSKVTGLQTTQAEHTTLLNEILARLPEKQ